MDVPAKATDHRVRQALDLLAGDLSLSRHALAERVGLSEKHLSRLIKKQLGRSLRDWKRAQKLGKARKLLEITDLPVKVVQLEVEWQDASNFCKAFRKHVGVSPREYRRANRRRNL